MLNDNKDKNCFFEFFKRRRLFFSSALIIIAIIIVILPQMIIKLPLVGDNTISGIELIMFTSQIVSSIFVIIGTVIAVWQYYLSSTKRIKELEFARVEKAIELSNYYKDNILNRYSVLKSVFNEYGITTVLEKKRKNCEIKEFDVEELHELYTEDEIKFFSEFGVNEKSIKAIINVASSFNLELKGYKKCVKEKEKDKYIVEISSNAYELFNDFSNTYIVETLNNAEYFAMAFTHKTADESVIYQSIYPSYIEMCFMLYYFIANNSDPKVAKLYTNLAELYCTWREREQEQKNMINKQTRNAGNHKGTIAN